ncbi:unnamed protein product [Dicrocoelium dendriticum]|nr:unnamed protein product [Dicrocoelium dendriticum]
MECSFDQDYEWVELLDPKSQRSMYVNLSSGECCWEPPSNTQIKPMSPNQWWELFDVKAQRNYYYNNSSGETVWQRPVQGDIVPLANLQVLQQNLRGLPANASTNDINLRQIAHINAESIGTNRRVHHRKLPTSIPETVSRNNVDLPHLLNFTRTHGQSSQMAVVDSQRVRDWLLETDMECKTPVLPGSNESTNPKSSGCFSDRPTRRLHQLPVVVTAASPTLPELNPFSTHLPEPTEESIHFREGDFKVTCNGLLPSGLNGNICFTPVARSGPQFTHVPNSPTSYPLSAVSPLWPRNHSPAVSMGVVHKTDSESPMDEAEHIDSLDHSYLPLCSTNHCYGLVGLPSQSNRQAPQPSSARNMPSLPLADYSLGSRQRAFPRTNPTVSRSSTAAGFIGPRFYLATTMDSQSRPKPCTMSLNTSEPEATSTAHFTATEPSPATAFRPCHPELTISYSNQSAQRGQSSDAFGSLSDALRDLQKPDLSVSEHSNLQEVPSPISGSPEPSSASSSYSRSSSETALTNTSSCRSGDYLSDPKPDASQVTDFASVNQMVPSLVEHFKDGHDFFFDPNSQTPDSSRLVDSIGSNALRGDTQTSEQPPVPPPRSASTIGSTRSPTDGGVFGLSEDFQHFLCFDHGIPTHPYTSSDQRPLVYYTPRLQYFIPTPVISSNMFSVGGMNAVSSLSRNDPMRAHVIPPNHRRLPPFQNQCRSNFTLVEPSAASYLQSSDDTFSQCTTSGTLSTSSIAHLLETSAAPFLDISTGCNSSAGTPGAVSTSTTITWASHSTTNLDAPIKKQTSRQSCASSNNDQCANLLDANDSGNVVRRSPSGGFIGPEDSTDSSGVSTTEITHINQSLRRPPLFTLVYPGHPAFAAFISPFDWPKELFGPEQDIATLMSWTKAKFSKRILANTDASMKKQVADMFKIVQCFMGDHKARLSLPDYGSIIIHRALNSVSLRDELYAQLCKQTTCNPDIRSLTNGWALLCICLYYFPPNNKFRDPLGAYLSSRAEASAAVACSSHTSEKRVPKQLKSSLEAAAAIASGLSPINFGTGVSSDTMESIDNVSHDGLNGLVDLTNVSPTAIITHSSDFSMGTCDRPTAAHFARVAMRWFTRSLNVGCRRSLEAPSVDEICHVKEFILKPCVFGSSMTEIMRLQSYRFPHLKLPWIQLFLTEELLRLNGSQTEGIFRLSPDFDVITEIRCQLERLFEVFRVIPTSAQEYGSLNLSNTNSADRFIIVRPPPPGWLYAPPAPNPPGAEINHVSCSTTSSSSSPSFPEAVQLTGDYSWPMLPIPLGSAPSDYVLLTPTSHWPRSLLAMAKRSPMRFTNHQVDAHLAAGLLKLWLRELAEPLIPIPLQPICLKAALEAEAFESLTEKLTDPTDALNQTILNPIKACCHLVRQVPPLERRSLLYLILLLQHLVKPDNAAVSLMDPKNLATVIAPNLMRSSTTDPQVMLDNIRPQTLFVRLLISHLNVDEEVAHLLTTTPQALYV